MGRIVGVYGRNLVRISVEEKKLKWVARPGAYVVLRGLDGSTLYGMVVGFNLVDELYRRSRILESIEGYEDITPARNELLVSIVGYERGGVIGRGVPSLPRPGDKVFLAEKSVLRRIFSGNGVGVSVGHLVYDKSVEVLLDVDKLFTRHLAILAMTGSGKSNTLAVIIAEVLKSYRYPRIILFDTHSEYVSLSSSFNATVYSPSKDMSKIIRDTYNVNVELLEVPLWALTVEEMYSLLRLDSRATKQRMYLRQAIRSIKQRYSKSISVDDPVHYTIEDLRNSIRGRDTSAEDLKLKVEELADNEEFFFITKPEYWDNRVRKLVDEYLSQGIEEDLAVVEASYRAYMELASRLLKPGLTIIALGGLSSETQVVVASMLLRALWRLIVSQKLQGISLPTVIALEEAHVYAPIDRWTPSREILEKISREGRKFGVGLIVVSQRPRELSSTLLAQCGNLIALRTVNPEDQRHILSSVEEASRELIESLPSLGVGEALVSGPAITFPAVVKIHSFHDRYGLELGGKDISFHNEWSKKPRELVLRKPELGELEHKAHRREKQSNIPLTSFISQN